jgi:methylenetetrahydrofolate reductase (NADPH)
VSWYASNAAGDFLLADPDSDLVTHTSDSLDAAQNGDGKHSGSSNAVTWGTFPGKEIITPTIIEELSFRAWAEEAFEIWGEWARVYEKGSPSREVVEGVRKDVWLVNIIFHPFVEKEGLWELLSSA